MLAVHARAAELGSQGALSQRARLMLDLVVDIKNNRKRGDGAGGRTASLPPPVAKLLRDSNVEAVSLQQLSWEKVWVLVASGQPPGAGMFAAYDATSCSMHIE